MVKKNQIDADTIRENLEAQTKSVGPEAPTQNSTDSPAVKAFKASKKSLDEMISIHQGLVEDNLYPKVMDLIEDQINAGLFSLEYELNCRQLGHSAILLTDKLKADGFILTALSATLGTVRYNISWDFRGK